MFLPRFITCVTLLLFFGASYGQKTVATALAGNEVSSTEVHSPDVSKAKKMDWTKIPVVQSIDSVGPRTRKGKLKIRFESSNPDTSPEQMLKLGTSELKRKASSLNGTLVLLIDSRINVSYGELPTIEMMAEVY